MEGVGQIVSHLLHGVQLQAHPWYRRGLPAKVQTMNEDCLRINPHKCKGYQTIDEIKQIVAEASQTKAQRKAADKDDPVGSLVDDMLLDAEIENDENEDPN